MKKLVSIKTETYSFPGGFRVDIVEDRSEFSAYIYHKNYAIKNLMFGIPKIQVYQGGRRVDKEEFLEDVKCAFKEYAEFYKEDFFGVGEL